MYISLTAPFPLSAGLCGVLFCVPVLPPEHDALSDALLCAYGLALLRHLRRPETELLLYALLKDILHALLNVNILFSRRFVVTQIMVERQHLCLLFFDSSVLFQVHFISYKDFGHIISGVHGD